MPTTQDSMIMRFLFSSISVPFSCTEIIISETKDKIIECKRWQFNHTKILTNRSVHFSDWKYEKLKKKKTCGHLHR